MPSQRASRGRTEPSDACSVRVTPAGHPGDIRPLCSLTCPAGAEHHFEPVMDGNAPCSRRVMPSVRLLSLALAGATSLALATPAAAFASPTSHSTAHRPTVAQTVKPAHHHGKPADSLAGVRKGALHALAASTAAVQRVAAAEQASTLLGSADKATLAAFDAAALTALAGDVNAAGSATSPQALAALIQAGDRTARAVKLAGTMTGAAATGTAAITGLGADVAVLKAQEASLPAGTDTSSVEVPLADLAARLSAAQTALSNATTAVLAVPAAPSAADLRTARDATESAMTVAQTALGSAAADLAAAQAALAALAVLTPPAAGA